MFKFFRMYQKWMLVVGVCILMVVFLLPSTSMFGRGGADMSGEAIGTVGSHKITLGDQRRATREIQILNEISPFLTGLSGRDADQSLQWLLMLHDAKSKGISASQAEAQQLMEAAGLNDPQRLGLLTKNFGVTVVDIEDAILHWAIVRQYRALILGLSHTPMSEWTTLVVAVNRLRERLATQEMDPYTRMFMMNRIGQEIEGAWGKPRVSSPMVSRFLQDQQAQAKISAVVVPAEKYLEQAGEPSDAELKALFDKHKDHLPPEAAGEASEESAGLGYRFPRRAKIEYLALSAESAGKKVEVDEAEALAHYEANKVQYTKPAGTAPSDADRPPIVLPYEDARDRVMSELQEKKTYELVERMAKAAEAMLAQDLRSLKEEGGYRVLPADWTPTPLRTVADELQRQFGVLPEVHRLDDQWLDTASFAKLPGIGQSYLPATGRRGAPFSDYVLTAHEFKPSTENLLVTLRLQARLASLTLVAPMEGSRYIFRLLAAEPERSPASLDEVRHLVSRDARRLAAFEKLKADGEKLLVGFNAAGAKSFAEEKGLKVQEPQPFRRREMDRTGGPAAPAITGVGKSQALADRVFEIAEKIGRAGDLTALPVGARSGVAPIDGSMSLVLFTLDSYTPMTKKELEQSSDRSVAVWLQQAIGAQKATDDPFALEALSKRIGFVARDEGTSKSDKPAATQPASSQG